MKATTKRTYRIQAYPKVITCRSCQQPKKRAQYYFRSTGTIKSYKCIKCCQLPNIEIRKPQIVLPDYSETNSEYHQAVEMLEHKPSFFRWLCSGENYYHKFAE